MKAFGLRWICAGLLALAVGCASGVGPGNEGLQARIGEQDFRATQNGLILAIGPKGNTVLQIESRGNESGVESSLEPGSRIVIELTQGVVPGLVDHYTAAHGRAAVEMGDEVWSSEYTRDFQLRFTQFDMETREVAGNFRFTARKGRRERDVLQVSDGSFYFTSINDFR